MAQLLRWVRPSYGFHLGQRLEGRRVLEILPAHPRCIRVADKLSPNVGQVFGGCGTEQISTIPESRLIQYALTSDLKPRVCGTEENDIVSGFNGLGRTFLKSE